MDENSTKQPENLLFPELFSLDPVKRKRIEVNFTAPDLSSQGGLLLLGRLDHRLGLIDRLAERLEDKRCSWLIEHTYDEMLLQRVFQTACDYEDADDCDDTCFNAYGEQQGTLFNDYYGEYCYMPLLIFEGISGKMILPMLRGGRRNKSTNIHGILRRLIVMMRRHWKKTRFIVRRDAYFCSFELIKRAENWLQSNSYSNPIHKWETKLWGENPADFGRK